MRRTPYERVDRTYLRNKGRNNDHYEHSFRIDAHRMSDSDPIAPRTPHGHNTHRVSRGLYHRPVTTYRPNALEHRSTPSSTKEKGASHSSLATIGPKTSM